MTYKSIFKGRLEFGSPKSYEKVVKMFLHRNENYYKFDVLLDEEQIFEPASNALQVTGFITQGTEKSWKNTVNLLEYVAQFAVAGRLAAWMINEGKVIHHKVVEPESDRAAVQAFLKGRSLSEQEGREGEAMQALNRAIEKYERHGQAYERRAYVNFLLKNYDDAFSDYSHSIELAPMNPEAYFGRGKIRLFKEDFKGAIADFTMAIKHSIPLQAINLMARRLKAELLIQFGEYKPAANELRFLSTRKLKPDNPNYAFRRKVLYCYASSLMELDQHEEAIEHCNKALQIEYMEGNIPDADIYLLRGNIRHKASEKDFVKDWEKAEKLGSDEAAELLKEHA